MNDNLSSVVNTPLPREGQRGGVVLDALVIGYPGNKVAGPMTACLHAGELCCLLGANGAGKSTLLRTLAAFQPALSGEMWIGERKLTEIPPRQLSTMIGIVLTERIRTGGITVRDMVEMGRSPYTNFWGRLKEEDNREVDEAMQQVGITQFADRQISTLSDGERQKVMIAKALAQGTPIILLDEPTAFLDFPSKVEIMLLLSRLAHEMGKTIFLSTHDLDLALQTSDCLWLMGRNLPLAVGTPRELASELPRYFPSRHLSFDAETLRFNIRPLPLTLPEGRE
ncbi:MAG: ABC transporter ATP-binding protein [Bacteroidaceae bacterium]|nr:ABC transporter ATP-binding protein [Bacteroidaceae bacterium]